MITDGDIYSDSRSLIEVFSYHKEKIPSVLTKSVE
jgi:hypothetical protein